MYLISLPGKTATNKGRLNSGTSELASTSCTKTTRTLRLTVFVKSVARHLKALNVVQHHYWIRLQIDSEKDINFTLNNNVNN